MPEHDCSKHVFRIRVSLDSTKLGNKQHANLIAALLRQLADYTDGYCSTENALDADLQPGRSMSFWFTAAEKRKTFNDRIGYYLRSDIEAALTRTNG